MSTDSQQNEPLNNEEIDNWLAFSSAVIENLDANGVLFEAITEWSIGRMVAFQQAFLTLNIATNPEGFGLIED